MSSSFPVRHRTQIRDSSSQSLYGGDIQRAGPRNREMNIVFASTGCDGVDITDQILPLVTSISSVNVRTITNGQRSKTPSTHGMWSAIKPTVKPANPINIETNAPAVESEAAALCEWADLLVIAPMDAGHLAQMLAGHTDNILLILLRSWNVSKKILLMPGMSHLMWENPMTKRQLSKIRRKWNWIQVLSPLLWTYEDVHSVVTSWDATSELVEAVRVQVDLMNIGHGVNVTRGWQTVLPKGSKKPHSGRLPPELWTMILDFTGDWELAQTLHIYTNLPPPSDWIPHTGPQGPSNYMETLELTILRGNLSDVKDFIATYSEPRWLSKLCTQMIMKFAMVPLLTHLETHHRNLFWKTFSQTFLPDKASAIFGKPEILEFWRTSPSFLTKEYSEEALDGASREGFLDVLEWWKHSGLPLKFTEAALEQASNRGHIHVLEFWKSLSTDVDDASASALHDAPYAIRLKPGRSICHATQNGNTDVVRWWLESGIAFPHEDSVAKLASTHGHVDILRTWHEIRGSKMIFDNQVLLGATKNGYVEVLEWWKQSGLKVEYKTYELEEALEDGDERPRSMEVRRWWAKNGLNLGVGTSEWMKTKYLNM